MPTFGGLLRVFGVLADAFGVFLAGRAFGWW
jgi:hypothetical protein